MYFLRYKICVTQNKLQNDVFSILVLNDLLNASIKSTSLISIRNSDITEVVLSKKEVVPRKHYHRMRWASNIHCAYLSFISSIYLKTFISEKPSGRFFKALEPNYFWKKSTFHLRNSIVAIIIDWYTTGSISKANLPVWFFSYKNWLVIPQKSTVAIFQGEILI